MINAINDDGELRLYSGIAIGLITGAGKVASMDGFYKNLSIMAGFLLLCITGREDIRSMHCAVSRRHNLCAIGPTMQHHVV